MQICLPAASEEIVEESEIEDKIKIIFVNAHKLTMSSPVHPTKKNNRVHRKIQ